MSDRTGAAGPGLSEASGEGRMSAPADTVFEDAPESWPVESATEVFRNWLIGVRNDKVRMPGGHVAERSIVTHPGAVAILALDDADRALMIRQYRHPVGRLLWELPVRRAARPSRRAAGWPRPSGSSWKRPGTRPGRGTRSLTTTLRPASPTSGYGSSLPVTCEAGQRG